MIKLGDKIFLRYSEVFDGYQNRKSFRELRGIYWEVWRVSLRGVVESGGFFVDFKNGGYRWFSGRCEGFRVFQLCEFWN